MDLPLSTLAADPDNPREIDEASREALGASLHEFGDLSGVTWNARTRQLVCGHQRLERLTAAGGRLEGDEDGTPRRVVDVRTGEAFPIRVVDWPIEKQRAANLVANSPHLMGRFTAAALPQIRGLAEMPSFAPLRLDALARDLAALAPAAIVEDEAPPAPAVATSRRGDLWTLGAHRLLCGDSTNEADVARLMDGKRAALMATDPPYGVAYADETGSDTAARKFGAITNDEADGPRLQAFLEGVFRTASAYALQPRAAWYLWHAQLTQGFFAAAAAVQLLIHRQIIWVKPSLLFGHGDYHWRHELCFYGWAQGSRPPFYGERNQTTVWELKNETSAGNREHPTQKPVALFAIPLRNHVRAGEWCYEPFAGSGTQIIAAEQHGARCMAIEIAPLYCDVIVERWQRFTGRDATLDGDGRTFADVAKGRARRAKLQGARKRKGREGRAAP